MRRQRPAMNAFLLLSLMLLCSGCYGPYQSPYGVYGTPYGGGYPAPGGPIQTLQPGGTYTPAPYGQPGSPYGTMPQESLGNPSVIDQTGGNSPYYNSGSTYQPYDGAGVEAVPHYDDPNAGQFQPPVQPDNTAVDSYGAVEGASAEIAGVAKVDFDTADFVAPVVSGQREMALRAGDIPTQAQTLRMPAAAPFAHDAEYTWLRGVLRFDATNGVWTMLYSDNPSGDDEHGGKLLVAHSPLLEQFKPQAVVLLRGGIDAGQSASAGRAVFRADVIEPVEQSAP